MVVATTESFIEVLRKSNLLTADEMAIAREAAYRASDAKSLARLLVQRELLTPWQAGQLLIGRTSFYIGRYRLLDLLGRGGNAKVYLARHTMMNRTVALKLVSEQVSKDPAVLERFLAEARAVAALDHPNIVRAYNVDGEGDRYYMVLEYVEGQDLQRMVEAEGPLDPQRAAEYIRQAADGLAHAHSKGMIHCDIKPSNLLVGPQGVVKILDLGLARVSGNGDDAAAPGAGKLVGTIDYMAPEQAAQSPALDHRADIYSLGCTLYFLLTGHPPFPEGTLTERIVKHQTHEPRSILEERPGTPKDLVRICQKMMAKDPAERFQSAAEVAAILTDWRPPAQTVMRAVAIEDEEETAGQEQAPAADAATATATAAETAAPEKQLGAQGRFLGSRRRRVIAGSVAGVVVLLVGVLLFVLLGGPSGQEVSKEDPTKQAAQKVAAKPKETPKKGIWGDLEERTFEDPVKKVSAGPGANSPKPEPAKPDPAKPGPAKPEPKADPSKAAPKPENSKPEPPKAEPAKPAAPEVPKPEPVKQDPSKPAPAKEPPKQEPAKQEPAKPEPVKQEPPKQEPAKPAPNPEPAKPEGDPLREFPKAIDLPVLGDDAAGKAPFLVGKIYSGDMPWRLELLGGDMAVRGNRQFALASQEADGKTTWVVTLSGKEDTQAEVAKFWRDKDSLMFQWTEGAEPAANGLRNCILDVRAGAAPRPLPLRSVKQVAPLVIDFAKGANETLELEWLPNPASVRLEMLRIDAKKEVLCAWDPKQPSPPKTPVVLSVLRKDIYNVEKPVFRFQVSSQTKSQGLTLDVRLRKDSPMTIPRGFNPEQARLFLTNPMREIDQQMKDEKKKNDQQLRAKKDDLDLRMWVVDTYQALHKAGRIHFQVYAEVGGQKLDLARTEAPAAKEPAKK